jgi:hypothetical protein
MFASKSLAKDIRAKLSKWLTQTAILLFKPCGNTDVVSRRLFSRGNFRRGKIGSQTEHPNGCNRVIFNPFHLNRSQRICRL